MIVFHSLFDQNEEAFIGGLLLINPAPKGAFYAISNCRAGRVERTSPDQSAVPGTIRMTERPTKNLT